MAAEDKARNGEREQETVVETRAAASRPARSRRAKPADGHVARALRSAYEETVREAVPDEFLDLLGKLG